MNKEQLINDLYFLVSGVEKTHEAVSKRLDYRDDMELCDIEAGLHEALKFLRACRSRRAGLMENYNDDLTPIVPFGEVEGDIAIVGEEEIEE